MPHQGERRRFLRAINYPSSPRRRAVAKPGSVDAAVIGYLRDPAFLKLAKNTRKRRRVILEQFRREHGNESIAKIATSDVQSILNRQKPSMVADWLYAMRAVCKFAIAAGLRPDDPTTLRRWAEKRQSRSRTRWPSERAAAKPGSVDDAVIGYLRDPAFLKLAKNTRKRRRVILEQFRREHGNESIAKIATSDVQSILNRQKPSMVAHWLHAMRAVCRFAIVTGLRPDDPTAQLKATSSIARASTQPAAPVTGSEERMHQPLQMKRRRGAPQRRRTAIRERVRAAVEEEGRFTPFEFCTMPRARLSAELECHHSTAVAAVKELFGWHRADRTRVRQKTENA